MEDQRSFAGLCGQAVWTPIPRLRHASLGARLNVTSEERVKAMENGHRRAERSPQPTLQDHTRGSGAVRRELSGRGERARELSFGSSPTLPQHLQAARRIDFGPEAEGGILEPATTETIEAGVKGKERERSAVVGESPGSSCATMVRRRGHAGRACPPGALENVGEEDFDGIEGEVSWASVGICVYRRATPSRRNVLFSHVLERRGPPTYWYGSSSRFIISASSKKLSVENRCEVHH